ncbi:unnamed protein product, partial [Chrysoparadoxa australica]
PIGHHPSSFTILVSRLSPIAFSLSPTPFLRKEATPSRPACLVTLHRLRRQPRKSLPARAGSDFPSPLVLLSSSKLWRYGAMPEIHCCYQSPATSHQAFDGPISGYKLTYARVSGPAGKHSLPLVR